MEMCFLGVKDQISKYYSVETLRFVHQSVKDVY